MQCKATRLGWGGLVGLLATLGGMSPAFPEPPAGKDCYVVPLGKFHGERVEAVIRLSNGESVHPGTVCQAHLSFRRYAAGKVFETQTCYLGESYRSDLNFGAYCFMGSGHSELFISGTMGRTWTAVYDPASREGRNRTGLPLYYRGSGRVHVSPRRRASGRYDLEENWPRGQWDDDENLGLGVYDRVTHSIVRRLHWNGTAFVPDHPGRSHVPPVIPSLAQIGGIRVGYDTIERLEERLGKGLPFTGGHPHGGRVWRIRGTDWTISADGFNSYARNGVPYARGRVTDFLTISRSERWSATAPYARLPKTKLRFLNVIEPGMTRGAVLAALHGKLPPPSEKGEPWLWSANGINYLNEHYYETKTAWTATLQFKKGLLDSITVGSD